MMGTEPRLFKQARVQAAVSTTLPIQTTWVPARLSGIPAMTVDECFARVSHPTETLPLVLPDRQTVLGKL